MVEPHREDGVGALFAGVERHPLHRFPATGDEVLLAGVGQAAVQRTDAFGELVLWAGLIAMFVVMLIVVHVYVPDEKKKE